MSAQAERWWEAEPDPDWRARAACRGMAPADGRVEPHPFFPADGVPADEVIAVCDGCSVREQCRADGKGRSGVWGAESKQEDSVRTVLGRQRRRRVHRLLASGVTLREILSIVAISFPTAWRDQQQPCDAIGCWCTERTEATR